MPIISYCYEHLDLLHVLSYYLFKVWNEPRVSSQHFGEYNHQNSQTFVECLHYAKRLELKSIVVEFLKSVVVYRQL